MHVRVNNRGNNSHCAPPASCISLPCCLPLNPQQQPSFLSPLAVGLFLSSFFCGSEKRTRELCVGENQKEKGTDKFSSARPAFLSSHHGPQIRHWPQNRTSPSATTKKESGKTKREEFAPSSFIQSKHKHPFFLSFPFLSSAVSASLHIQIYTHAHTQTHTHTHAQTHNHAHSPSLHPHWR